MGRWVVDQEWIREIRMISIQLIIGGEDHYGWYAPPVSWR